jgi:hypothetical protein
VTGVPQEIATSFPEGSANALRQPAGGVDDSTSPLLSAAKQAEVLGQETPVMRALPWSGCTGNGLVQPGDPAGWTALATAGDVVPAEALGLAWDPVLAAGSAGPSGAVSLAA